MIATTCSMFIADFFSSGLLSIAYYSHLIPIFIALVLVLFVLFRSKFSLLSKVLAWFSIFFCLWLIGDLITWTTPQYDLISAVWASLDYINIIFYLFGAYFFAVLIRGRDIAPWQKIVLFLLTLPGFYITVTGNTIQLFNEPWCEAFNNTFLTKYKIILESLVVLFIAITAIIAYKRKPINERKQVVIVGSALILFFATFSITEYIASQTGIYEINLYSLFVLPVFLALIIYAITNLEVFHLRSFATQLLIYVLLIMIGSQFFFLESTTDKTLTVITFALSLAFSYFLMKVIRREAEARKRIEQLAQELEHSNLSLAEANEKLKGLDKLKTEFLSLASHQLRSPLTAIKGYSSMLFEGAYGKLEDKTQEAAKRIYTSAQGLVNLVEDLLNISKIEQGGMKYEFSKTDLAPIVMSLFDEMQIPAQSKHISFKLDLAASEEFVVNADPVKIKQVFLNLTDNSIKYTPEGGEITISLTKKGKEIIFAVQDNGMGISPETRAKLFEKFSRGEGGKTNTGGSGLGLYLAKQIAIAHKGDVTIESEGLGKGSTFKVTIPVLK